MSWLMADVENVPQHEHDTSFLDESDLQALLDFDPASLDFFDVGLSLPDNDNNPPAARVSEPGLESLDDVQQFLLNDDIGGVDDSCPTGGVGDDFFAGVFLDSPVGSEGSPSSGVVQESLESGLRENRDGSSEKEKIDFHSDDGSSALVGDGTPSPEVREESLDFGVVGGHEKKGREMGIDQMGGSLDMADGVGSDDLMSKKRKRQLRNRDSAMRSRDRKRTYIRDLELKSKFLEGECKRLQYLLSCCVADNQILHHQLQARRVDASGQKQESAVLPLESLLLGSLFWLLSVVCFFLLPAENLVLRAQNLSGRRIRNPSHQMGLVAPRKRPRNNIEFVLGPRKWKSTKWRMKWSSFNSGFCYADLALCLFYIYIYIYFISVLVSVIFLLSWW